MKEINPQFNATYFRDYGIHSVANGETVDHLASFPNWKETEIALKNDLPSDGAIITPEYITVDHLSQTSLSENTNLINERIDFIKDLSLQTEATFYLGTPLKTWTRGTMTEPSREIWRNTALQIKNGAVEAAHTKKHLLPVEEEAGIIPEERKKSRQIKNGRAVLVCADLYSQIMEDDPLFKLSAKDIIAPTMWASPLKGVDLKEAGARDEYYRSALEQTVSRFVLKNLPNVNRITTVDRGRPDIAPYNAVFTRK